MAPQGIKTYQKNVFKTNADNRKVVALLYEGVIQSLYIAINAIEAGDTRTRNAKIDKALQIIHYMSVALDHEKGGEIAANLGRLYDYCRDTITQGNLKGDIPKLREAIQLFAVVLDGWKQISEGPLEGETEANRTPIPTDEKVEVRSQSAPPARPVDAPTAPVPGPNGKPAPAAMAPPPPTGAYGRSGGYGRPNGAPRPGAGPIVAPSSPSAPRDAFVG